MDSKKLTLSEEQAPCSFLTKMMNTTHWVLLKIKQSIDFLSQNELISAERVKQLIRASAVVNIKTEKENDLVYGCIIGTPKLVENGRIERSIRIIFADSIEQDIRWKYRAYHEISHFLSIDEVQQVDFDHWVQPWGLCTTHYFLSGQNTIQVQHRAEQQRLNENATDYLAAHLFSVLEDIPLDDRFLLKQGKLKQMPLHQLCKYYLNEHTAPQ